MTADYKDRQIESSPDALLIHGYYLPWAASGSPMDRFARSVESHRSADRTRAHLGHCQPSLLGQPRP